MASKKLLREISNKSQVLEVSNAEVLRINMAKARKELLGKIESNPLLLSNSSQLAAQLELIENSLVIAQQQQMGIVSSMDMGTKQSKLIVAEAANIDRASAFWGWQPLIPLEAVSLAESQFIDQIKKATKQLKKDILTQAQLGIIAQDSNEEIARRILGTGIQGLKGKDGAFRSATLRSQTIGRTVTNDLINRAALRTYNQVDDIVPELQIKLAWQSANDTRTSDRCISLLGQIVSLGKMFRASDGWMGEHPPAHPNCRSRVTSITERYRKEWELRWGTKTDDPLRGHPRRKTEKKVRVRLAA